MTSVNINDLIQGAVKNVETKFAKNTTVIDGKTYKIVPLSWGDGIDLWENFLKKALPAIGSGLDGAFKDELQEKATFTEVMLHLSHNLDGSTLKNYSLVLFNKATVDGEPLNINEEFTGRYGVWMKLFAFAFVENFSSFFDEGWGDMFGSLVSLVAPAKQAE